MSVSILTRLALVPHVKVSFTIRSLLNLQLNKEPYETNIYKCSIRFVDTLCQGSQLQICPWDP